MGINEHSPWCPLCGDNRFRDFRGRVRGQCANCKSLERVRLLWLALLAEVDFDVGPQVFHFAPEAPLMRRLHSRLGDSYVAADLHPERYDVGVCRVRELDLCEDLPLMRGSYFDVIIHNHVLEHVPCSPENVLHELTRILSPGGRMFFSVPFRGRYTDEDLSPELSKEERRARFAQEDHMRIFGRRDFPSVLRCMWGVERVTYPFRDRYSEEELARAMAPLSAVDEVDGTSIFFYIKPHNS